MKSFKNSLLVIAVLVIAAVGVFTSALPAQAQSNRYAVVCLFNNTDLPINYQYKWGNGSWESDTLDAGYNMTHSWKYARGLVSSPKFTVKFDADLTDSNYYEVYSLERYQATNKSCDEGKIYNFEFADSRYINLYSDN